MYSKPLACLWKMAKLASLFAMETEVMTVSGVVRSVTRRTLRWSSGRLTTWQTSWFPQSMLAVANDPSCWDNMWHLIGKLIKIYLMIVCFVRGSATALADTQEWKHFFNETSPMNLRWCGERQDTRRVVTVRAPARCCPARFKSRSVHVLVSVKSWFNAGNYTYERVYWS